MTKIITTIGPASEQMEVLEYFAQNNVEFARLNFSHNSSDWHLHTGENCRKAGLKLLFDLSGPKIRLGILEHNQEITTNSTIILEMENTEHDYPYVKKDDGAKLVFPYQFPIYEHLKAGDKLLIDDGKIHLQVQKILGDQVYCEVVFGGMISSKKGISLPDSHMQVKFLRQRDKDMLQDLLLALRPEIVAISFVQSVEDVHLVKKYIRDEILVPNSISDYFPKICTKLEMQAAVKNSNLHQIVEESDLIMIARGDLALETNPAHLMVPFFQDKIVQACQNNGKPFVVATQILESMINSPVPTRAEVSDLYRAVILNQANYVMLSGESATGMFPQKCVELMNTMIVEQTDFQKNTAK